MRYQNTLRAHDVRKLFHYDKVTGVLTWRKTLSNRNPAGSRAGGPLVKKKRRTVGIFGSRYAEHRIIWVYVTGRWPRETIDHKNRDQSNNRWKNLRQATHTDQKGNYPLRRSNTSGARGVYRLKSGKWRARLKIRYVSTHLGYFRTKKEAVFYYNQAARKYFGRFFVE